MKKVITILSFFVFYNITAQFKINIEAPSSFLPNEVYLYGLNGSKDILQGKQNRKGNLWQINVSKPYIGMMKLYFPDINASINFISENKDVRMKFETDKNKIVDIQYLDESNSLMNDLQDLQQKRTYILPALDQIIEYYKSDSEFKKALANEIFRLSQSKNELSNFPFVDYYNKNYNRFIEKKPENKLASRDEIIDFLTRSNDMLETSSLLRPILVNYLNVNPTTNLSQDIDKLLKSVNVETPRGQTILSELIEIFDAYEMKDLKDKYLSEAKNLKCTINDRLSATIATNKNTEIGAKFPNYIFKNVINTKEKSVYDIKADKKIIIFWASTCSHCEKEIPQIIEKYNLMKSQKIEVIAFSLDSNKEAYESKIKDLPWINDSELKGWYSSYAETYNIHATPSYFVLDANNKIIAKPDHVGDLISFLKLN